jgi:hypothetical protein
MKNGNTYEVTLSVISDYSFKEEKYFTTASSSSKACFNVYYKHTSVKSLIKRDLGKLSAKVIKNVKNSQEIINEFLEMNYNDILLYERDNIII